MDMTTVEGKKFEKSEEHEAINVTNTDRNMEHYFQDYSSLFSTTILHLVIIELSSQRSWENLGVQVAGDDDDDVLLSLVPEIVV